MNSKNRIFFFFGVLLAGLTAFGIYSALSKMENLVPVVIATKTIEPHNEITSQMVKVEEIPAMGRPDIAIDDPAMVIGGWSTTRIFAGQMLIQPMVAKQFDETGSSGVALSIPDESLRAVAFPVSAQTIVGGKVKKGDYLDVIAAFDGGKLGAQTGITKTILQGVEVFDVTGKDEEITGVTLLVTLEQAEILSHAYTVGTITYALNPGNPKTAKTTGMINSWLCERYGFKCEPQK